MRRFVLAAAFILAACGPKPRDVRVMPPPADASWYEVTTPEQIIPAGSEKMFCTDLIYRGETTPFRDVDWFQGKFGHHVILMSTSKPREEGTTYDCTDISSMKNMRPFGIPLDLPPGYAFQLETGTPLVVQLHYVNTSKDDLLVRDVIRLKKVLPADVTQWAAPLAANSDDFALPPRSADIKTTFDCTIEQDVDLLLLGGHMHENGTSFKTEIGPDVDHLTRRYEVTAWKADYRDSPPVELFTTTPLRLTKGNVIRTTCIWNNQTDQEIKFPHEMCATFGVVGGTKIPWVCNVGTQL